jgi:hypothetical protein
VILGNVVKGVSSGDSIVESSTSNYNLMVQNILNGTITFVGANSAIDWTDDGTGAGDGTRATAAAANKSGNNLIY